MTETRTDEVDMLAAFRPCMASRDDEGLENCIRALNGALNKAFRTLSREAELPDREAVHPVVKACFATATIEGAVPRGREAFGPRADYVMHELCTCWHRLRTTHFRSLDPTAVSSAFETASGALTDLVMEQVAVETERRKALAEADKGKSTVPLSRAEAEVHKKIADIIPVLQKYADAVGEAHGKLAGNGIRTEVVEPLTKLAARIEADAAKAKSRKEKSA